MSDRVKVAKFGHSSGKFQHDKIVESLEEIDAALVAAEEVTEALPHAVVTATPSEIDQTVTLRGDALIKVEDAAGDKADALVRVWFSATEAGEPSATDNNTTVIETGTLFQQITEHGHYLILSDDGEIEIRLTVDGAGDRYVNTEVGGVVKSAKLEIATIGGQ